MDGTIQTPPRSGETTMLTAGSRNVQERGNCNDSLRKNSALLQSSIFSKKRRQKKQTFQFLEFLTRASGNSVQSE